MISYVILKNSMRNILVTKAKIKATWNRYYRIYSIKRRGIYEIFPDSSAAFIRGRRLYEGAVYFKSDM